MLGGVPTFAYVITSYQPPMQVLRLVTSIVELSPAARVIVVTDPAGPQLGSTAVRSLAKVVEAPDAVGWGTWSFMRMQLTGAQHAVADPAVDYVLLISGQDYPLQSLDAFEREVVASRSGAWIERFDHAPNYEQQLLRYERQIVPVPAVAAGMLRPRAVRRVINRTRLLHVQDRSRGALPLVERRAKAPLSGKMTLTSGNNWWVMRRDAMELVLDAEHRFPVLAQHFSRSFIPSEGYPHTVLSACPELAVDWNRRLQYTRWSGWSPQELSLPDVTKALASGLPFARKFRADSPALDAIDEHLGIRSAT